MSYFSRITSLADLKKQYRRLALENHPDRGGSTQAMQQINAEFEKLYPLWEKDKSVSDTVSGYENDYCGSTAKEYTSHVYNEYRWQGSNYKGQNSKDIVEIMRKWVKETYPDYKFSIRREHYSSIHITLTVADFVAFKVDGTVYRELNIYHLEKDDKITDRALEVMENVRAYAMSYNFDDSDPMTDYFHTNFYLHLAIGDHKHPYKIEIPKSRRTKGEAGAPLFTYPEGATHKAIRQALGKSKFQLYKSHGLGEIVALGEESFWEDGRISFWPLSYSSRKVAQKRMDKLLAAGIKCHLTGYNSGYLVFDGYTAGTEAALERERNEVADAYKKWQQKQAA